jgi:hypothetical protein
MKKFLNNPVVNNIISAMGIAFLGMALLNLTFIVDALYQGLVRGIISLFIPLGPDMELYWFPPLMHGSFVVMICIMSYFIFRSRIKVFYKAAFMAVPVAVVLVTLGMFLYRWPIILYSLGTLSCISVLYWLYHKRLPWQYYYTLILFSLALAIFTLLGGEI